jgi:SAM-dependent methyltransferase
MEHQTDDQANHFNNIKPDLQKLYKEQDAWIAVQKKRNINISFLTGYFRLIKDAALYKFRLIETVCFTGVRNNWFVLFKSYWIKIYGGRNINLDDFFALKFEYRKKAQSHKVLSWDTPEQHIENWQQPENVSQLFHYTYKGALNPLMGYKVLSNLKPGMRVLEYGCSLAPYYATWRRYSSYKKCTWTLFDIPNHAFHFARYLYSQDSCVEKMPYLAPAYFNDPFYLVGQEKFDFIIITTVFEHLDDPLIIAKAVIDRLNDNGYLLFDYILSDGEGLDTKLGLEKRQETLKYLFDNLAIENKGSLNLEETLTLTLARKIPTKPGRGS